MSMPRIVSRDMWLSERKQLLAQEEEAARQREHVNAARRQLPMVEITKRYTFEGPGGNVSLLDLFDGRRQLIVYHFMFDPEWNEGCRWCSYLTDNVGYLAHMNARDTSFALISRAPLSKIAPFKARMGWTYPWFSSFGSGFNEDFYATLDGSTDPITYMYKDKAKLDEAGEMYFTNGEQGGASVFLNDDGRVFHTYSTFSGGIDLLHGTDNFLDLTPLGRGDDDLLRHHDKYEGITVNGSSPSCRESRGGR